MANAALKATKPLAHTLAQAACALCLAWGTQAALGQPQPGGAAAKAVPAAKVVLPPGVTEAMLAPPPMPGFMLDKNARGLTPSQMAAEAAKAAATAKGAKAAKAARTHASQRDAVASVPAVNKAASAP